MRYALFILCCLVYGFAPLEPKKHPHLMSLPKSGTHMTFKLFQCLFGQNYAPYPTGIQLRSSELSFFSQQLSRYSLLTPLPYIKPRGTLYYSHFKNFPHPLEPLKKDSCYAHFVQVRDPRDVCVSLVFDILESKRTWLQIIDYLHFLEKDFDKQLTYIITHENPQAFFLPSTNLSQAANLMYHPDVCLIRFEDLVGAQGGGSDKRQREQLHKIAEAVGVALEEQHYAFISHKLFGPNISGSSTFRKGHVGAWKTHFTEEHKALFKEKYGALLIEMGYENNNSW